MNIAERDRLITVERNGGTTESAFGEITASWATYSTFYAKIVYGTGAERRATANEGAEQTATFYLEEGATANAITTEDRINYNGDIWDILNVSPFERASVDLTAKRRTEA